LGMIIWSNYRGFHHDDNCVAYIAVDLRTSGIATIGHIYLVSTAQQVKIMATNLKTMMLKTKNNKKKQQAGYAKSSLTMVLNRGSIIPQIIITANGIIPRAIMCNSQDNTFVQHLALGVLFAVYSFFVLYLIYKGVMVLYYVSATINLLQSDGSNKKKSAKETVKWRKMRVRYVVYVSLMVLTAVYQLSGSLSAFTARTPQLRDNPDNLLKVTTFLADYITFLLLASFCYNNYLSSAFLRSGGGNSKTKFAILMSYVFSMCGTPAMVMFAWIRDEYNTLLSTTVFVVLLSTLVGVNLILACDWTRKHEVNACSNFLHGNLPKFTDYFEIFFEIFSLSIFSLDNLFVWWTPAWVQLVGNFFFQIVSVNNNGTIMQTVYKLVSPTTATNGFYFTMIVFLVCLSTTKFFHFPKLFVRLLNIFGFVVIDVAEMPTIAFILKRIHCSSEVGSISKSTSLHLNGTMVGYEGVLCDHGYKHSLLVFTGLGVCAYMSSYGVIYNAFIRNIYAKPAVMSIPGFNALKFVLKLIMTVVISFTYEDGMNNATPWIRATSNCFCISILVYSSVKLSPVLGPLGKKFNSMRSTGYGLALGFNIASWVSLFCQMSSNTSSQYTLIPLLSFLSFPLAGAGLAYWAVNKWISDNSKEVSDLCEAVKTAAKYEAKIAMSLDKNQKFEYTSALLVHAHPDYTVQLNEKVVTLDTNIRDGKFTVVDAAIALEARQALDCLLSTAKFSVGLKEVNKVCGKAIVNVIVSSLQIFYNINEARNMAQSPDAATTTIMTTANDLKMEDETLATIVALVELCCDLIIKIVTFSKHYKITMNKSAPFLLDALVSFQNSVVFLESWRGGTSLVNLNKKLFTLMGHSKVKVYTVVVNNSNITRVGGGGGDETNVMSDSASKTGNSATKSAMTSKAKRVFKWVMVSSNEMKLACNKVIATWRRGKGDMVDSVGVGGEEPHDNKYASVVGRESSVVAKPLGNSPIAPGRPTNYNVVSRIISILPSSPNTTKVAPAPTIPAQRPTEVVARVDMRGILQQPLSCCLLQHANSADADCINGYIDGVLFVIDMKGIDKELTRDNVMEVITDKLKAIYMSSILFFNNNSSSSNGRYCALFMSVGVIDLKNDLKNEILDLWEEMREGGEHEGNKFSTISESPHLLYNMVHLSITCISSVEYMGGGSDDNEERRLAKWIRGCYSILETVLHADLDEYLKEIKMWVANGVIGDQLE
jgi:hypothetical protein